MTPIFITQGDSGENVSTLGDDRIGNIEKNKSSYEHVSNSERLPRYSCSNL